MKRLAALGVLLPCLLCACTAPRLVDSYERDELLAVQHNQQTDCTLLIYRDPLGQVHHIFRRHGVFEFALTFTRDGGFAFRERGGVPRSILAEEAHRLTQHVAALLQRRAEAPEQLSSI